MSLKRRVCLSLPITDCEVLRLLADDQRMIKIFALCDNDWRIIHDGNRFYFTSVHTCFYLMLLQSTSSCAALG